MADVVSNALTEYLGDGTIDLDTHTFKLALVSDSYTPDADDTVWADISSNELGSGNGYTTGGETLTSVTWTRSGSTTTFDADNVSWTSATFTARYGILYDDTPTSPADPVIKIFDFGENKSPSNGTFTINFNASGIFTLSVS